MAGSRRRQRWRFARRSTCAPTPCWLARAKVLGGTGRYRSCRRPLSRRTACAFSPIVEGDGRHPNVQVEPAFQKGWFEIQDEGSQIAAQLAGAKPGMQVLDYCAGGGGKTLSMSAQMDNKGQIFAYDSAKRRALRRSLTG
jgi:16S rRNA (cytosine967-C5)-methyltransferase